MRNILEIRDLQVHYGGIEAVRGISLDVPEGEIVTLIGANGAGKSSTLRAIAGLVKPSAGKISFLDEDITGMDSMLSDREAFLNELNAIGLERVLEVADEAYQRQYVNN